MHMKTTSTGFFSLTCALLLLPTLSSRGGNWADWPVVTSATPAKPSLFFEPYWDSRQTVFDPEDVTRCCDIYEDIRHSGNLVISLPAGMERPPPPLTVRIYPTEIARDDVRRPSFAGGDLPRKNPCSPVILPGGAFRQNDEAVLEYKTSSPVFPLRNMNSVPGGILVFRYLVFDGREDILARGTLSSGIAKNGKCNRCDGDILIDSSRSLADFVASPAFLFYLDDHVLTLSQKALDCDSSDLKAAISRLQLFNYRLEAEDEATASELDAIFPGWRTCSPLLMQRPGALLQAGHGLEADPLDSLEYRIETAPTREQVALVFCPIGLGCMCVQ